MSDIVKYVANQPFGTGSKTELKWPEDVFFVVETLHLQLSLYCCFNKRADAVETNPNAFVQLWVMKKPKSAVKTGTIFLLCLLFSQDRILLIPIQKRFISPLCWPRPLKKSHIYLLKKWRYHLLKK